MTDHWSTLLDRLAFPVVARAVEPDEALILELTGDNRVSEERLRQIEARHGDEM